MPTKKTSSTSVNEQQVKESPKNVVNTVLVGVVVIASFVIGSLYQKVKYLEGNKTTVQQAEQKVTTNGQAEAEPEVKIEKVRE